MTTIAAAIANTRAKVAERPDRGPAADAPVTATLESGLRCRFTSGHGDAESDRGLPTDMPPALGGAASAPSPGHYLRGAIAACAATAIGMRAAEDGVEIERLSVTAASTSNVRTFLGIDEGMVGFTGLSISIDICAPTASDHEIRAIIDHATAHAPVGQSLEHPVATTTTWSISRK